MGLKVDTYVRDLLFAYLSEWKRKERVSIKIRGNVTQSGSRSVTKITKHPESRELGEL